jgi:hypothetical protein
MQLGHRLCSICCTEKPIEDFIGKRGTQCGSCCRDLQRERQGRSPASWSSYIVNQARANAKRTDREFNITGEQIEGLYWEQQGACALSGLPMQHHPAFGDMNVSIDRIDSELGYVIENIQLVCWRINLLKNDLSYLQLLWWVRALVANDAKKYRRSRAET